MRVTHAIEHGHPEPSHLAVLGAHPHAAVPTGTYPAPPQIGRWQRLAARVPRWSAPAAIATCFAGAAGLVFATDPSDGGADDVTTCLVKMTTGLDCPGCGGTRAFYFLMRGNIPEAARHHAIAVFAAPFLVWLYLAWAVELVWGRKIPAPTITAKAATAFLAAWGVFMVVRNLPFAPFTSLYV